eukprot:3533928-Rhodomonas_salina.1
MQHFPHSLHFPGIHGQGAACEGQGAACEGQGAACEGQGAACGREYPADSWSPQPQVGPPKQRDPGQERLQAHPSQSGSATAKAKAPAYATQPFTLTHKPQTPNPQPQTLNPRP